MTILPIMYSTGQRFSPCLVCPRLPCGYTNTLQSAHHFVQPSFNNERIGATFDGEVLFFNTGIALTDYTDKYVVVMSM